MTAVPLHSVSEGEGPTVLLLHGFPEYHVSWRKQLPALARAGFRAVAPDLRGYHRSPKPADVDAYRVPELVDDVVALIERLGAPVDLVGHDWGGVVAWFVAMGRPELLRKLVILNSPHPVPFARELRRSREQKLRASYQLFFRMPLLPELYMRWLGKRMMRRAGRFTAEEVETYARMWRDSMTTMLHYYNAVARSRGELRQRVRPIHLPVLMIWGERDPVFTRATTEDFGEYVPDLRVERIADAGHFVQTDAAERVNALLIDFLR